MPKKSRTSKSRRSVSAKTRKQKVINMIGCSKKHKHNKSCKNAKDLGNNMCPKCGPNCHCGPNCNCPHPCPGTCYLNRKMVKKGGSGSGCGSCGCPIGGLSYTAMNKFGGAYKYPEDFNQPVLIDGTDSGNFVKIPGTAQKGGTCGSTCGLNAPQSGGNFFKSATPIPGPYAGSAWGTSVNEWPGMNGIGGDRNYLGSYGGVITNDPQQQMSMADAGYKTLNSMVGGKHKKRKSRKSQRGGGLVPQDLVNLGRNFTFNLNSAYNSLNGYKQPVDPLPYKDQLTRSFTPLRIS